MRIGIYTPDFTWAGGVDLLHGMVKGLLTQRKQEVEIFILVNDPSVKIKVKWKRRALDKLYRTYKTIKSPQLFFAKRAPTQKETALKEEPGYSQKQNIEEIFANEKVTIITYNKIDPNWEYQLNLLSLDCVLPILGNDFNRHSKIPWVGYIFDFVYKYHTHLYSKEFCLETDINFAKTLLNAESILVNSKSVAKDVVRFFPYAKAKIFQMPFAPYGNAVIYEKAISNKCICEKYKIENPFFIISNQFWLHKAHDTAIKALKILSEKIPEKRIDLVCTGSWVDLSGTSKRVNELKILAEELEIGERIHFLGHLPKADQLALMLRSLALIQTTQFEGGPGGGSVYMATANGVSSIVSDIDVNKEIVDEPLVTFFKVLDAEDLAIKMKNHLNNKREFQEFAELEKSNNSRLAALGELLLSAVLNSKKT